MQQRQQWGCRRGERNCFCSIRDTTDHCWDTKPAQERDRAPVLQKRFLPFNNSQRKELSMESMEVLLRTSDSGANSKTWVTFLLRFSIWGWPLKFFLPQFTHSVGYPSASQQRQAKSPLVLLPSPVLSQYSLIPMQTGCCLLSLLENKQTKHSQ